MLQLQKDLNFWPSAPHDLLLDVLRHVVALPSDKFNERVGLTGQIIKLLHERRVTPEDIASCLTPDLLVRAGDVLLKFYDAELRRRWSEGFSTVEAERYREAVSLCYRLAQSPDGFQRLIDVMANGGADPEPALRELMGMQVIA
jgi:hypothetical protein